VVIIAPMTTHGGVPARGWSRVERVVRSAMTKRLDKEVELLERAGVRVIRVEPDLAELEAMGPNFMDLSRRDATLQTAAAVLPGRIAALTKGSLA
jgi:NTE family protein